MIPQTRYAMLGELGIAYQTIGEGPPDLMWSAGSINHVDEIWEDPSAAVFLRRVAGFSRLTRFDVLGSGASDRIPIEAAPPAFERQLDAVCAVTESNRFALLAMADVGPGAIEYAAAHPERVSHLILFNTSARLRFDTDYPIGLDDEASNSSLDLLEQAWGTEAMAQVLVPGRANDDYFVASMSKYMRSVGTPREIRRAFERSADSDVRHLLPRVEAPTMVLYRQFPLLPETHSQYLAEMIPGAIYTKLPGASSGLYYETPDLVLEQIERFITDAAAPSTREKSLKALLFTDIVDSTARLEALGDRDWSAVLGMHDEITARRVTQHGGSVVKSTGDGVLATFSNPGDAALAAESIRDELARMSVEIRSGIHFGETQETDDDLLGVAVHIAARVMNYAGPGEVLVSRTVRDLLAGSNHVFVDAGTHELKGIAEPWQLYRLVREG